MQSFHKPGSRTLNHSTRDDSILVQSARRAWVAVSPRALRWRSNDTNIYSVTFFERDRHNTAFGEVAIRGTAGAARGSPVPRSKWDCITPSMFRGSSTHTRYPACLHRTIFDIGRGCH